MSSPFELAEPSLFTLITDNEALNDLCRVWSEKKFLALDTEFIRTSTFYPKVGLIQVCDGCQNYLIDPLEISEWQAFQELMLSPTLLKIFHSCTEDLLVFFASFNLIPSPIFDTQIAAAFLNEGFGLSYQNLVKARKDIEIPKEQTRSEWLQRPLSAEQCQYAALDVAYLPEIYNWQTQQLKEEGKLAWLEEESQRLTELYSNEVHGDFSQYYLSIKSAWQLSGLQLAALKSLTNWREIFIRKRNKPRNWIIKDKELIAIAKSLPEDKQRLLSIAEIESSTVRYESEVIIKIIQEVKTLSEVDYPKSLPRPLTGGQKNKLKTAQKHAEEKAQDLALPVELLARKRCLMALFNNVLERQNHEEKSVLTENDIVIPAELQGWRKQHLLQALLGVFQ